jgi:hypothetical protein
MPQSRAVAAEHSVRRTPLVQLLWAARTVSLTGSAVTWSFANPSLPTHRLTAVDLVAGNPGGRPYAMFGLVVGAVVDRIDRRRIIVGCDLASACLLGMISLAALWVRNLIRGL